MSERAELRIESSVSEFAKNVHSCGRWLFFLLLSIIFATRVIREPRQQQLCCMYSAD